VGLVGHQLLGLFAPVYWSCTIVNQIQGGAVKIQNKHGISRLIIDI
jgi:hypothetical protein